MQPSKPVEVIIMSKLFESVHVGRYTLPNRLVMAPMTRSRALADGTPGELAAEYYAQRASVGLIVTEGTQPSEAGQGYMTTPGIYSDAHVAGWKKVTSAVHEKGGHLFIQLMHAGRMSHPDNTRHHRVGVAPSAIAPGTAMFTASGMQDIPVPRALTIEEIRRTVDDFRTPPRCRCRRGRCRNPRRECLSGSAVLRAERQYAHRRIRRPDRKPRTLCARSRGRHCR